MPIYSLLSTITGSLLRLLPFSSQSVESDIVNSSSKYEELQHQLVHYFDNLHRNTNYKTQLFQIHYDSWYYVMNELLLTQSIQIDSTRLSTCLQYLITKWYQLQPDKPVTSINLFTNYCQQQLSHYSCIHSQQ